MKENCCATTKRQEAKAYGGAAKRRGDAGFSLSEMLLCMIIISLAGSAILATMNLGIRQFEARTRESEQRLLCNTLSLAVQEYLTYANAVTTRNDGGVKYLDRFKTGVGALYGDKRSGKWCQFADNDGKIVIRRDGAADYYLADQSQYIVAGNLVAPQTAFTAALRVTVESEHFVVKVSVSAQDDSAKKMENDFIVMPIDSNIWPSN